MNLSHYTKEPLIEIRSTEQPGTVEGCGSQPKPFGLWLSVDGEDDWAAWCRSEDFNLAGLGRRYRIYLKPDANILQLQSSADIFSFTEKYDKPVDYGRHLGSRVGNYIDWERLAQEYQGIVIAPYQWECRLHMQSNWYYSWDCASGCVWDANAIDRFELSEEVNDAT